MSKTYLNGRFLTQPRSGVQRYAFELISALDELAVSDARVAALDLEVLTPPGTQTGALWRNIAVRPVGRLGGHAWEQIDLARFARGGTLVNLCGAGPLTHERSVLALHDAAIFAHPENFAWTYRRLHQFLRPRLARRAHRLITVSAFSRVELARYCGVPESRFTVIGDSAEHILSEPPETGCPARLGLEAGRYLLCVGNRTPNKNLPLAARAFAALGRSDLKLAIVGGDHASVFGEGEALAGANIVLTGRVSDGELRALYEQAALFVFPSRYEGFGVPPLEAMALGCAVVSSDAASMREVLGDAARYFTSDDANALTATLAAALDDIAAGHWSAAPGKAQAARYSWAHNAAALAGLLSAEDLEGARAA
jgi:glycosyltransferase involved in cell wall biosynthesis